MNKKINKNQSQITALKSHENVSSDALRGIFSTEDLGCNKNLERGFKMTEVKTKIAEQYEKEIIRIEKKFIINKKEVKIWKFFQSIKCCQCGAYPKIHWKSYKIGRDVLCQDCYNKLMINKIK